MFPKGFKKHNAHERPILTDPNRRKQFICEVCASQSWRRESICAGCNLPFAPQKPLSVEGKLRSSAGTLQREGSLYAGL